MTAESIAKALNGHRAGATWMARCPAHDDNRPSLSISCSRDGKVLVHCHAGCEQIDVISALRSMGAWGSNRHAAQSYCAPSYFGTPTEPGSDSAMRIETVKRIWAASVPATGTPVETYLKARGLSGRAPPTLRYLAALGQHAHAMIAACGPTGEDAPGILETPRSPTAVHITRLSPDGSFRTSKTMLGPVSGRPIVLAPPNDALGVAIAEGIEDALSLHEATGLGAWAGGSAGHMAKLGAFVPGYIDCVTIAVDANDAGQKASATLQTDLASRGISVRLLRVWA